MSIVTIRVQESDFDLAQEYRALRAAAPHCGAIVSFVGLVRDFNAQGRVDCIILEHYPAMTEKVLQDLVRRAQEKWALGGVTIIHRIGQLHCSEQIVLVLVASEHRAQAFEAAQFLMDFLKTEAPFWKREQGVAGTHWVDAKDSDQRARERWER